MPRVFKQQYTRPIPEGAEHVKLKIKRKGKEATVDAVRFRGSDGKWVTAPVVEKGKTAGKACRVASPKWYGRVNGEAVPLCTNRAAAEIMLGDMIRKAEQKRVGLADPFEEHRKRPLPAHLEDFRKSLIAKGNTIRHVRLTCSRLQSLFAGCGFNSIDALDGEKVADWLVGERAGQAEGSTELPPGRESFTVSEASRLLGIRPASVGAAVRRFRLDAAGSGRARRLPRETVQALLARRGEGMSVQTSNHYLAAVRAFGRWLVRSRRTSLNPFAHLEVGNVQTDRRHDRRELSAGELRRLLDAARGSKKTFRGLTGEDRFHLYAVACGTGFRAAALASLTPDSFDLAGQVPTVTLAAKRNKSRKLKVQPLPPDVAELLRAWLPRRDPALPVWPGRWAEDGRAADMLRIDLEAAGIPYSTEGPDGPLFADFHALRHTYLTLGGRAGIDLRTLQELAGHCTPTLTARYSHRRLHDLAGAVEKLPAFLPEPVQPEKWTG